MKNQNNTSDGFAQAKIAKRSYEFWEAAGRPAGKDAEFWLRAESELLATTGQNQPASVLAKSGSAPARSAPATTAPIKPASTAKLPNPVPPPRTSQTAAQRRRN